MRYQSTDHFCGPAAVANALRSLGKNITEMQVEAAVAKAYRKGDAKSVEGTSQSQIKKALDVLKYNHTEFNLAHAEASWRTLRSFLNDECPVLLAVDDSEHWVAAIGTIGKRVLIADGLNSELVLSYDREEMLARWGLSGDVVTYYGLVILPKKRGAKPKKIIQSE
jgi:ABC-type bacteriocin/lantibiotic exporter with double-glycine peptidase domain